MGFFLQISDDDLRAIAGRLRYDHEVDPFWRALGVVVRELAAVRTNEPAVPNPTAEPVAAPGPTPTVPSIKPVRSRTKRQRPSTPPAKKEKPTPPDQTGKTRSPEARERMRVAMEASWARRRGGDNALPIADSSPAVVEAGEPARPDFTSRARAAADRTWRETHPNEASA